MIWRLIKAHPILIPTIWLLLLSVPGIAAWDALPDVINLNLRSG